MFYTNNVVDVMCHLQYRNGCLQLMPLPTTQPVPATINLSASFSKILDDYLPITFKLVPKNADGTIYNCTAATDVSVATTNSAGSPFFQGAETAATLGTHDATGVVVSLTDSQVEALFNSSTPGRYNLAVIITDGTTNILAGSGSASLGVIG
jgi:hypothetical protein